MNRSQYAQWCENHAGRLREVQRMAVDASRAGLRATVAELEVLEKTMMDAHQDVTARYQHDTDRARAVSDRFDRTYGTPPEGAWRSFQDLLRPPDPVEAFAAIGASLPAPPPAPDTPDTTDPASVEALATIGETGRTGVEWHENDEEALKAYDAAYRTQAMVEDENGDRVPLRNYEHDIIADTGERVRLSDLEHLDGSVPNLDDLEAGVELQTRITEESEE